MFECIHDFKSAKDLSEHLKSASRTYYGEASREYLRKLVALGYDGIRARVQGHQKQFFDLFMSKNTTPEVARAGVRFSLVAAGGELLTELGISGWQKGEALNAVGVCFEQWRTQHGESGSWDEQRALRHVKSILIAHGNSRFQLIRNGQYVSSDGQVVEDSKIFNRIGYRTSTTEETEYIVLPDMFHELCGPYAKDLVLRALHKFLVKDSKHLTVKRNLPEVPGRPRCYVISGEIFGGNDAEITTE